jgi:hypothetical protein
LATVLYAKAQQVPSCSQNQQTQEMRNSSSEEVLEIVGGVIDKELAQALGNDIKGDHDTEL